MFDPTSRYYYLPVAKYNLPDGRILSYKHRRFVPQSGSLQTLAMFSITQGDADRIDRVTARTLGVPEQFWQICDANTAMNPPTLTQPIGREIRIPIPQAQS